MITTQPCGGGKHGPWTAEVNNPGYESVADDERLAIGQLEAALARVWARSPRPRAPGRHIGRLSALPECVSVWASSHAVHDAHLEACRVGGQRLEHVLLAVKAQRGALKHQPLLSSDLGHCASRGRCTPAGLDTLDAAGPHKLPGEGRIQRAGPLHSQAQAACGCVMQPRGSGGARRHAVAASAPDPCGARLPYRIWMWPSFLMGASRGRMTWQARGKRGAR